MDVEIVQTGSSGNCVILDKTICLDCGVSFKKLRNHLNDLQLVFISHAHADHFNASTILRLHKYRPSLRFCGNIDVADHLLEIGVKMRNIDLLEEGKVYDYGFAKIEPFALYHDKMNYGLKIYKDGQKAIYIVDTGYLDGIEAKDFDLYLVEANHTQAEIEERVQEKIAAGEYAYEVRAAKYHLSYEQTADWLAKNMGQKGLWYPLHQHEERNEDGREKNVHTEDY